MHRHCANGAAKGWAGQNPAGAGGCASLQGLDGTWTAPALRRNGYGESIFAIHHQDSYRSLAGLNCRFQETVGVPKPHQWNKLRTMNYLAHLHLGGPAPAQLLGSLYGDFVKGRLEGRYPADIEAAIRLHRRIDMFTDSHPLIFEARMRFPAARRRTSGILLDLFFDHCLAHAWDDYASEPLPAFTTRVYQDRKSVRVGKDSVDKRML